MCKYKNKYNNETYPMALVLDLLTTLTIFWEKNSTELMGMLRCPRRMDPLLLASGVTENRPLLTYTTQSDLDKRPATYYKNQWYCEIFKRLPLEKTNSILQNKGGGNMGPLHAIFPLILQIPWEMSWVIRKNVCFCSCKKNVIM